MSVTHFNPKKMLCNPCVSNKRPERINKKNEGLFLFWHLKCIRCKISLVWGIFELVDNNNGKDWKPKKQNIMRKMGFILYAYMKIVIGVLHIPLLHTKINYCDIWSLAIALVIFFWLKKNLKFTKTWMAHSTKSKVDTYTSFVVCKFYTFTTSNLINIHKSRF